MCVSHTAGWGVTDTMPSPYIMYQYEQGAQKGLTATKKTHKKTKTFYICCIYTGSLRDVLTDNFSHKNNLFFIHTPNYVL